MWCWGLLSNWWAPIQNNQIKSIIAFAIDNGIKHFDTAKVYWWDGESIFSDIAEPVRVSTKIPAKKKPEQHDWDSDINNFYDHAYIQTQLEDTLVKLAHKVDIVYLHNRSTKRAHNTDEIIWLLHAYKQSWNIQSVGVSLPDNYTWNLEYIINNPLIEYIQINQSIIHDNSATIHTLKQAWKKINVRSIFHQWLLLHSDKLPAYDIRHSRQQTNAQTQDIVRCLNWINNNSDIHWVILGMRNKDQIIHNISLSQWI